MEGNKIRHRQVFAIYGGTYVKKVVDVSKWLIRNFFLISIGVFIVIYLRWFRLTPLVFDYYNDPNGAYIVGLILLSMYIASVTLVRLAKNRTTLKKTLFIPVIFFFGINVIHASSFFPSIENNIKCNGNTYYITWMHPFGDYQWTFDQLTMWRGLKYETQFFGYSEGPFEIVCDKEKEETNIIRAINGVLIYSHGENSRGYYGYAGAQLEEYEYFLSDRCNNWNGNTCPTETYTLYECNLNYTSCDSLGISYTEEVNRHKTLERRKRELNVGKF